MSPTSPPFSPVALFIQSLPNVNGHVMNTDYLCKRGHQVIARLADQ